MAIADWTLTPNTEIPFEWSTKGNPGGCAHWWSTFAGANWEGASITRSITIPTDYTKIQFQFDEYVTYFNSNILIWGVLVSTDIGTILTGATWIPTVANEWQTSTSVDATAMLPAGTRTLKIEIAAANVTTLRHMYIDNIKLIGVI